MWMGGIANWEGWAGRQSVGENKLVDMQPKKLGQVLGISARVAAKTIRERAAQAQAASADSGSKVAGKQAPATGAAVRPATREAGVVAAQAAANAAESGKKLARGAGRLGATMLKPVARAGGILALQITGVFFALFALFFLSHGAQTIRSAGWHDRHGQVYVGLGLVFAWFTVSSFWRARQKGRA
jgi:hypothetical protein